MQTLYTQTNKNRYISISVILILFIHFLFCVFVNVLGVSFFVTVVENLTCKHAHENLYY